jgi:hypothetical protein
MALVGRAGNGSRLGVTVQVPRCPEHDGGEGDQQKTVRVPCRHEQADQPCRVRHEHTRVDRPRALSLS